MENCQPQPNSSAGHYFHSFSLTMLSVYSIKRWCICSHFLFTLEDGQKVVGRIALPVCETVKTEAEVAPMVYVRGTVRHYSTNIVPLESNSLSLHPHTCPTGLLLL